MTPAASGKRLRIVIATLACAGLLAAVAAALLVYAGVYDISATRPHTAPVHRTLELALERAVRVRAADIAAPALDAARATRGEAIYRQHCVQCHGAPGEAPQPFALGLNPAPPPLVESRRHWSAAELFWIVRHGIKMTGMPAWQYRLADEEIWDVVAFLAVMPEIAPADWQARPPSPPRPVAPATAAAAATRAADPRAGRAAMQQYLCATCHTIPGVTGARNQVGPPLGGLATRGFLAGRLPNTAENLAAWLREPQRHAPGSAMPDLHVSEQDARDMAAFLYTLVED